MENASKALLIAGGILIAMIVISIFIMGYSNITQLAQTEVDAELKQQIDDYNKPYLAFNKNTMYGIDVISALNLAISNNKLNKVSLGEEFYVDVSFKLKDLIQDREDIYTLDTSTNTQSHKIDPIKNYDFKIGETYKLSSNLNEIINFLDTANNVEQERTINETDDKGTVLKYTVRYSGIADFKRKTFKCSKVEYDSNGRVKSIEFEQR